MVAGCPDGSAKEGGDATTDGYDFTHYRWQIPADITKLYGRIVLEDQSELRNDVTNKVILLLLGGPRILPVSVLESSKFGADLERHRVFVQDYDPYIVYQMNYIYAEEIETLTNKEVSSDATTKDDGFSIALGAQISQQNAEIVMRVASHFVAQGKEVYLHGASYGASLINYFYTRYPTQNKIIAKSAILAGRLTFPQSALDLYAKGYFSYYKLDTTDNTVLNEPEITDIRDEEIIFYPFATRTSHSIFAIDYTKALDNAVQHDVLYIASPYDRNVGPLQPAEIAYISQHSRLFYTEIDLTGDIAAVISSDKRCGHDVSQVSAAAIATALDFYASGTAPQSISVDVDFAEECGES